MNQELHCISLHWSAITVHERRFLKTFHGSMRLRRAQTSGLAKFSICKPVKTVFHQNGQYNDILSLNHVAYYIRELRICQPYAQLHAP